MAEVSPATSSAADTYLSRRSYLLFVTTSQCKKVAALGELDQFIPLLVISFQLLATIVTG